MPPQTSDTKGISPPKTPSSGSIVWIEDDYPAALEKAKRLGKPLLIDMWADWCHTCLAMKKGTLQDPGLSPLADSVVWLSIDSENPKNAYAMATFSPRVWPSFFVVSPVNESVQATQLGSCSVREFRSFVERGSAGHLSQLEDGGFLQEDSPLLHLRMADRAVLAQDLDEAAKQYAEALRYGGDTWEHAPVTYKKQLSALSRSEDKTACTKLAQTALPTMIATPSSASTDFVYYASTCADALEGEQAQKAYRKTLTNALDTILAAPNAALSSDDRSDALATSRSISEKIGDQEAARQYALQQQALLKTAVAGAQSAKEEMTYVWHQVEVHAYLEQGEAILPWVQKLTLALPNEYDPPYRLAWLFSKMKRYDEALDAITIALPLAQGARKGRVLSLQADIYKSQGNAAAERASRQAVVAHYKALAKGMVSPSKITRAEEALAKLP